MAEFEFPAQITSNGRVTIPKKYRTMYGLEQSDDVLVTIETND